MQEHVPALMLYVPCPVQSGKQEDIHIFSCTVYGNQNFISIQEKINSWDAYEESLVNREVGGGGRV